MPNDLPPDSDEALVRLHRAGWSIGDVAFHEGADGLNSSPQRGKLASPSQPRRQ
jgi:hypothetical protein